MSIVIQSVFIDPAMSKTLSKKRCRLFGGENVNAMDRNFVATYAVHKFIFALKKTLRIAYPHYIHPNAINSSRETTTYTHVEVSRKQKRKKNDFIIVVDRPQQAEYRREHISHQRLRVSIVRENVLSGHWIVLFYTHCARMGHRGIWSWCQNSIFSRIARRV